MAWHRIDILHHHTKPYNINYLSYYILYCSVVFTCCMRTRSGSFVGHWKAVMNSITNMTLWLHDPENSILLKYLRCQLVLCPYYCWHRGVIFQKSIPIYISFKKLRKILYSHLLLAVSQSYDYDLNKRFIQISNFEAIDELWFNLMWFHRKAWRGLFIVSGLLDDPIWRWL